MAADRATAGNALATETHGKHGKNLVDDRVVVELKAVDSLTKAHAASGKYRDMMSRVDSKRPTGRVA